MATHLELFDVIRLLSAEDVEVLAARFDTAPTRFDIVFACLTDEACRRALCEYLYAECTTPAHKPRDAPTVPPAPIIPHKHMPLLKHPRVVKCLALDRA